MRAWLAKVRFQHEHVEDRKGATTASWGGVPVWLSNSQRAMLLGEARSLLFALLAMMAWSIGWTPSGRLKYTLDSLVGGVGSPASWMPASGLFIVLDGANGG